MGRGRGEPRTTKKKVAQTTTPREDTSKATKHTRAHQKAAKTSTSKRSKHLPCSSNMTRTNTREGKKKREEEGIHRFKREKREGDCVSDESPEAPTRTGALTHGHEAQQCEKSIDRWA